jgi:hypothetical protein
MMPTPSKVGDVKGTGTPEIGRGRGGAKLLLMMGENS